MIIERARVRPTICITVQRHKYHGQFLLIVFTFFRFLTTDITPQSICITSFFAEWFVRSYGLLIILSNPDIKSILKA